MDDPLGAYREVKESLTKYIPKSNPVMKQAKRGTFYHGISRANNGLEMNNGMGKLEI